MAIERGHPSIFTKWMFWSDTPVRGRKSTLPNPYFYFLFCFLFPPPPPPPPPHTHTHTHTHTEPLNFTAASTFQLQPEYRVCTGGRITLRCDMSEGNPPPGPNTWLRNGVEVVASGTRVTFPNVTLHNSRTRLVIRTVEEGDAGIYQCLNAVDNQPATTIVQSGYVNVYCKLIPNTSL